MYCMNCRQELPKGAKFCFMCGTTVGSVSPEAVPIQEIINLDGSHTLLKMDCESCGAHLEVDVSKKIAHCDHCGSDFLVQDAVKELNVNGNIQVGNATIKIDKSDAKGLKSNSEDDYLRIALELLEIPIPAYSKAGSLFDQMCQDYPKNYKGWLGAWVVFEYFGYSSQPHTRSEDLFGNALNLSPEKNKELLSSINLSLFQCEPYNIPSRIDGSMDNVKHFEEDIRNQITSRTNEEKALSESKAKQNNIVRKKRAYLFAGITLIVVGIILGFLFSGFRGVVLSILGIALGIGCFFSMADTAKSDYSSTIKCLEQNIERINSNIVKDKTEIKERNNEIEKLREKQVSARQYYDQLLSILKS